MTDSERHVGILGLGLVGTALVERLSERGWTIAGYDVDEAKCLAAAGQGAAIASSPDDLVATCDTVLLCVPTSRIVSDVLDAASASLRPGTTFIDMTTGDPSEIESLARWLAERDVVYLEAKIAGSSVQLRQGDAVLFVATTSEAAEGDLPAVFADITSRVFPLRPIGAAARFKLVHNLALGLHRAVLAETLHFAESCGFDAADTLRILQQTPAASRVMEKKGDKMVQRDYTPQATLSQHLKDVRLILEEAARDGASVPLSTVHEQLLENAQAAGFGAADNSAVREAFRKRLG